jgi:hypothetical protein
MRDQSVGYVPQVFCHIYYYNHPYNENGHKAQNRPKPTANTQWSFHRDLANIHQCLSNAQCQNNHPFQAQHRFYSFQKYPDNVLTSDKYFQIR